MVLTTYPIAAATAFPEDASRRITNSFEWDATPVATLIKNTYGGNGLPNATFSDIFVPQGWVMQEALYTNVVYSGPRFSDNKLRW
jgi:hypothetical protein